MADRSTERLVDLSHLIVDAALVYKLHIILGLTLFLIACLLLAVPMLLQALLQYSTGNFNAVYPAWPWGMHKNFIGNLMGIAALLLAPVAIVIGLRERRRDIAQSDKFAGEIEW